LCESAEKDGYVTLQRKKEKLSIEPPRDEIGNELRASSGNGRKEAVAISWSQRESKRISS